MIAKTTLEFLSELADNNNREWFDQNRKRYEAAKKDVSATVDELIAGITNFDGGLLGIEAKQCMFRIFKDVRFSKNKIPYKSNMGAWMAAGGRKSPFPGYYLHVEAGDKSFLAGGCYMPQPAVLRSIRESIDYDANELREVIASAEFGKYFDHLEGDKVKTAPKGYSKDHADIDLLRHKSLVVSHKLKDEEVLSGDFLGKAMKIYEAILPLNSFLKRAVDEAIQ